MNLVKYGLGCLALLVALAAAALVSANVTQRGEAGAARIQQADAKATARAVWHRDIERGIERHSSLISPYTLHKEEMPWQIYPGIPEIPTVWYYTIRDGIRHATTGHLTVVQYVTKETADRAYAAIRTEAESGKTTRTLAFGDRGSQSGPTPDWNASDLIFQQCHIVFHLTLQGDTLDQIHAFAQAVHDSLSTYACEYP